jgi:hypothetical protein
VRLENESAEPQQNHFSTEMQPLTRAQLQNARETSRVEKDKESIRQQELTGQLWAEQIYKRVKETAELGYPQYQCHWPSTFTAVAYTYALLKLREWFPDSKVDTVLHGALTGGEVSTSVRIRWGQPDDMPPSEELMARRLEKETSW